MVKWNTIFHVFGGYTKPSEILSFGVSCLFIIVIPEYRYLHFYGPSLSELFPFARGFVYVYPFLCRFDFPTKSFTGLCFSFQKTISFRTIYFILGERCHQTECRNTAFYGYSLEWAAITCLWRLNDVGDVLNACLRRPDGIFRSIPKRMRVEPRLIFPVSR